MRTVSEPVRNFEEENGGRLIYACKFSTAVLRRVDSKARVAVTPAYGLPWLFLTDIVKNRTMSVKDRPHNIVVCCDGPWCGAETGEPNHRPGPATGPILHSAKSLV
jgi:hypothetical protein